MFLFPRTAAIRKVMWFIWPAFIAFSLIDFFLISAFKTFGSVSIAVESLILLLLCGYYLYYQITTTMTMFVYRTFNFWVIVTFLMYVSATFFLYFMTDTMSRDSEFRFYFLYINVGANVLKNLLLAFAISRRHVLVPADQLEKAEEEFDLDLGDELLVTKNIS